MRFSSIRFRADLCAVLALALLAGCRPARGLAIPSAAEDMNARLNIVFFPSTCSPCSSIVAAEIGEVLRERESDVRLLIVEPPTKMNFDAFPAAFRTSPRVKVVKDHNGKIEASAGISVRPYLLAFDERRRILFAEALAPAPAVHADLKEQLLALYTVP